MSISYTQCAFRANKVVDMEVEAEFVYADILRTLQSSILGHDTTVRPGRAGGRRRRCGEEGSDHPDFLCAYGGVRARVLP